MNNSIAEYYDKFVKIVKTIEKFCGSCQVKEAADETEIAEYEQKIGYKLPDEYKDWLRLTKGISISLETVYMKIYMDNKANDHEDGFKALMIGNGAFTSYYMNLETAEYYVYDDDFGTEQMESFEELLDCMYTEIEDTLDNEEAADNWRDIYNEV